MPIRPAGVATTAEFPRRPLSFPARHRTHHLCADSFAREDSTPDDAESCVCAALSREVEARCAGRLDARSLRDPKIQVLLNRAHPGWR